MRLHFAYLLFCQANCANPASHHSRARAHAGGNVAVHGTVHAYWQAPQWLAQACVAEDVSDAALAALLDANDALNAALRLWQDSRKRAPGGGRAAPQASSSSEAAAVAAASWRTQPGQMAAPAGGSFRAEEQHTQWYSPLGSSLHGGPLPVSGGGSLGTAPAGAAAAPAPSGAATALPGGNGASLHVGLSQRSVGSLDSAPVGSAAGVMTAHSAGRVAESPSAAAASDWLLRGETPLINLLSWHEPRRDASAPAPKTQAQGAAAEPRAASSGASARAAAMPSESGRAADLPALSTPQSALTPGDDRRSQGSSAASVSVRQSARGTPQHADAADSPPGWQAFAQTGGHEAAEAGTAGAAAATQAAPKHAAGWGDGLPGPAPGGAAWALSGSRRAAVAAQGRGGRGSAASASPQHAERPRGASAPATAVLPVEDASVRPAQDAVVEGLQGAKAAAPGVNMQEVELKQLRALLRCGVSEIFWCLVH